MQHAWCAPTQASMHMGRAHPLATQPLAQPLAQQIHASVPIEWAWRIYAPPISGGSLSLRSLSPAPWNARGHASMQQLRLLRAAAASRQPSAGSPMLTGCAILMRSASERERLTGVGVWLRDTLRTLLRCAAPPRSSTQMSGVASSSTAASSLASCRLIPSDRSGSRHRRANSGRALSGACAPAAGAVRWDTERVPGTDPPLLPAPPL
eukprot:359833-Chlamydomonas_euryale.AAC.2